MVMRRCRLSLHLAKHLLYTAKWIPLLEGNAKLATKDFDTARIRSNRFKIRNTLPCHWDVGTPELLQCAFM